MKPEPSSRHPLVVFLLSLCLVSGAGIGLGAPAPGSIEEQLPRFGVYVWALALAVGAAVILAGLAMQANNEKLVVGVLFEQVGVVALGFAAIIYGTAAYVTVGWSGLLPAGITFTFGIACLYRWITLQAQLNPEGWVAKGYHSIGRQYRRAKGWRPRRTDRA